jgi:hypothetical protein
LVFVQEPFEANFHFAAAIIFWKHATTLHASGFSFDSALAQAELDYQKSNIGSCVASHFTAPPQQYSVQEFVDFIMCAQVCLFTYLLRDHLICL